MSYSSGAEYRAPRWFPNVLPSSWRTNRLPAEFAPRTLVGVKGGLVVRITPADVGQRVSVRSRIAAAPGEPATTDTLGYLRQWEAGQLRIEKRDGALVVLDEADLLAGKVIGEPPLRRHGE